MLAAAAEALLQHHVEVGEDDEGEGDVQAAAVLLHQEVPLEFPHLVVVLLDGAHSVAAGEERRSSLSLPHTPTPLPSTVIVTISCYRSGLGSDGRAASTLLSGPELLSHHTGPTCVWLFFSFGLFFKSQNPSQQTLKLVLFPDPSKTLFSPNT